MPQIYVKIVAAFFVLAGLVRMFYPYVIAPSSSRTERENLFYEATQLETNKPPHPLPSAYSVPISDFHPHRAETSKITEPSSVTEHTTKSLDNRQDTNEH